MTKICWDTALKIRSSNRLNSSKQPHAPTWHNPTKIRPIALKSNDSSQLNTNTKRPNMAPNILTLSVLPVPAGPGGKNGKEKGGMAGGMAEGGMEEEEEKKKKNNSSEVRKERVVPTPTHTHPHPPTLTKRIATHSHVQSLCQCQITSIGQRRLYQTFRDP
jgi:hypothetical protein